MGLAVVLAPPANDRIEPTPTSRLPSRITSFPSLSTTTASPPSLPQGRTLPREPGLLLPRRPRRLIPVEKTRPPRFLDDPCVHAPLSDPGGPPNPGHFRTGDVVFRLRNDVDSASTSLGALSRGLHALCVRFAAGVAFPGPRNTRFRLVASLDRSGLSPAGSHRRFPSCLSVYMASPFTKLCLAHTIALRLLASRRASLRFLRSALIRTKLRLGVRGSRDRRLPGRSALPI